MLTILCIATYFKGEAYLRECRRLGCTVLLLTADSLADAAWPRDVDRRNPHHPARRRQARTSGAASTRSR